MNKALIVALDNIGDLVFCSVLCDALHRNKPELKLAVWCKQYAADIAKLLPGSPTIISSDPIWDKSPGAGRGRRRDFIEALKTLRQQDFSLSICTTHNWRATLAMWLTGARQRFGFRNKADILLTDSFASLRAMSDGSKSSENNLGVCADLLQLLTPLGLQDSPARYRLVVEPLIPTQQSLQASFPDALNIAKTNRRLLALHPFAGHPRRCWPLEQWLAAGEVLEQRGFALVWIGSPIELTRLRTLQQNLDKNIGYYADHLLAGVDSPASINNGTLFKTAALIGLADLFVGHDSGPLHIAAGLSVPCVGLYLPGEPQRTYPQGWGPSLMLQKSTPQELELGTVLTAVQQFTANQGDSSSHVSSEMT